MACIRNPHRWQLIIDSASSSPPSPLRVSLSLVFQYPVNARDARSIPLNIIVSLGFVISIKFQPYRYRDISNSIVFPIVSDELTSYQRRVTFAVSPVVSLKLRSRPIRLSRRLRFHESTEGDNIGARKRVSTGSILTIPEEFRVNVAWGTAREGMKTARRVYSWQNRIKNRLFYVARSYRSKSRSNDDDRVLRATAGDFSGNSRARHKRGSKGSTQGYYVRCSLETGTGSRTRPVIRLHLMRRESSSYPRELRFSIEDFRYLRYFAPRSRDIFSSLLKWALGDVVVVLARKSNDTTGSPAEFPQEDIKR